MKGKELLELLQGLSEEDLEKEVLVDVDDIYTLYKPDTIKLFGYDQWVDEHNEPCYREDAPHEDSKIWKEVIKIQCFDGLYFE